MNSALHKIQRLAATSAHPLYSLCIAHAAGQVSDDQLLDAVEVARQRAVDRSTPEAQAAGIAQAYYDLCRLERGEVAASARAFVRRNALRVLGS